MKKLLGIIVLSLLLSGNAYAFVSKNLQQQYIDSGLIKVGMKMSDLYSLVKSLEARAFVPNYKTSGKYLFLTTSFHDVTQTYLAEATNSNPKKNKKAFSRIGWKLKNYKLIKIYEDPIVAYDYLISLEKDPKDLSWHVSNKANYIEFKIKNKIKTTQSNTASSSSGSSTISTKDKITQSKQICTDLSFQPKTEKHADCSMQMMSIQFQTTNKVASASGGTTQEVIVTHRNDYDIWDALVDYSRAIDPKNKTTTSSSSSNRGTNCVIGRTNPTFGTTTMNCN
jgi:hypothetical protein